MPVFGYGCAVYVLVTKRGHNCQEYRKWRKLIRLICGFSSQVRWTRVRPASWGRARSSWQRAVSSNPWCWSHVTSTATCARACRKQTAKATTNSCSNRSVVLLSIRVPGPIQEVSERVKCRRLWQLCHCSPNTHTKWEPCNLCSSVWRGLLAMTAKIIKIQLRQPEPTTCDDWNQSGQESMLFDVQDLMT